jgi:hypothetical protein
MAKMEPLPRSLELGLNGLTRLRGCKLIGAVDYDHEGKNWIITLILERKRKTKHIPKRSEWKVLVNENYPYGSVGFYPSFENSITATFPHQERNDRGPATRRWRDGKLCLDSPFRSLRFATPERAPLGDPEEYLAWYGRRAIAWLNLAANGKLLRKGDPFEVPRIPLSTDFPLRIIVYDETPENYRKWGKRRSFGTAQIGSISGLDSNLIRVVGTFTGLNGDNIRKWEGRPIEESDEASIQAFWWLWPDYVVLPPWYAPRTWGDLRQVGKKLGVRVDDALRFFAHRIRGAEKRAVLLIGYPIPERVGLAPSEIHWDAVVLPALPPASGTPPKGYRPNEKGWWRRDRTDSFGDDTDLAFCPTENWSSSRLQARGRLPQPVQKVNAVIVGVGALGSCIVELLSRTGIENLTLIDNDLVTAGNACRHIATLADVPRNKAAVLARRLLQISPYLQATRITENLPPSTEKVRELLDPYGIIIECTASDDVLGLLASVWWAIPRLFLSTSVGYAARRFYVFAAFANEFPLAEFNAQVKPWLREERQRWPAEDELIEGAGCWSPSWPGRYDDIMLAASICLKEIEKYLITPPSTPILNVYDQVTDDGDFQSCTRVSETTLKNKAETE